MEAIILAGGKGTRLQSVVSDVPKPMAPINGKPFLELILDKLLECGINHFILSVGYKHDIIESYFGPSYKGISISYSIENKPLGTGGAIAAAFPLCNSDVCLIVNGDTFLDFDINSLIQHWCKFQKPTLLVKKVLNAVRYGSIITNGIYVTDFVEKGQSGPALINAGSYLLPTNLFVNFSMAQEFSFEIDFILPFLGSIELTILECNGIFIDIGIPEDYYKAQSIFA